MDRQKLFNTSLYLLAGFFLLISQPTYAGVSPQPFKTHEMQQILDNINLELGGLLNREDLPPDTRNQIQGLINEISRLSGAVQTQRLRNIVSGSVGVMDGISAVMFSPKPEPPLVIEIKNGVDALTRLVALAFDPQSEPPILRQVFGVMNRINEATLAGINSASNGQRADFPDDTPPPSAEDTRAIGLQILSGISAVAFNPQLEPPAIKEQVISIFDRVSAVMFSPKPEPPSPETLNTMMDALNAMSALNQTSHGLGGQ